MSGIEFKNSTEVVDAFTGGPVVGEACQCKICHAVYAKKSVAVLVDENAGQCIACGNDSFVSEKIADADG